MTNERVLTEAQVDLGVELRLWKDLRIARMFFILLSRGIPIADVIDIIAKYRQQTYHNKDCQQEAAYRRVLATAQQKKLAYAAEVEAKAELVDTEAARVEPVVEEPTTEEPAKEESERGHGKLWALGRSITERNNQNKT